jgi:hypothetical protein
MKKLVSLVAVSLLFTPFVSSAVNSIMPSANTAVGKGMNISMVSSSVADVLSMVANYVIGALLLMAVFYILWAAFTFITSAGETEKVSEARKRIMYAGIGVVVALLAKGIVSLVLAAVKS